MAQHYNRYIALDVLRGLTVAGMIMVNNSGFGGKVFTTLRHASWAGCTLADLVFPFFLFIVGSAMAFSFAKFNFSLSPDSLKKIFYRGILIFLVGVLLNAFPFYPLHPNGDLSFWENLSGYWSNVRIFGVLQRIAMCYVLGGIVALWFKKTKPIVIAMNLFMLLHWVILYLIGDSSAEGANGVKGVFSLAGQGAGAIDIALVGAKKVYYGYGIAFDPEGVLGTLSGVATVLLGYVIGGVIRDEKNKINVVAKLYTIGLLCVLGGIFWANWYPMVKALWTGSFVLYTGGWSIIMLAMFIFFIDIKGWGKIFTPFKAMGMNPLFAYVVAWLCSSIFGWMVTWKGSVLLGDGTMGEKTWSALSWYYVNVCQAIAGNTPVASLIYSLSYVAIFVIMALILYKKRIIIKL